MFILLIVTHGKEIGLRPYNSYSFHIIYIIYHVLVVCVQFCFQTDKHFSVEHPSMSSSVGTGKLSVAKINKWTFLSIYIPLLLLWICLLFVFSIYSYLFLSHTFLLLYHSPQSQTLLARSGSFSVVPNSLTSLLVPLFPPPIYSCIFFFSTKQISCNMPHILTTKFVCRSPWPTKVLECRRHWPRLFSPHMEGSRMGWRQQYHQLPSREARAPNVKLDKSWQHEVICDLIIYLIKSH